MRRISKENYYLDIAETVLERATCLRRVYGAIIVKNDEIIATGYNGAPRGRASCSMCRRLVINAGLEKVVIRRTETEFHVVHVEEWIAEDDLLAPKPSDGVPDLP